MEAVSQGPCLDTVRALHQTVVALRAALEQSRSEISELKSKCWPIDSVKGALSIEDHAIRQKFKKDLSKDNPINCAKKENDLNTNNKININNLNKTEKKFESPAKKLKAKILIKSETRGPNKISKSLESLTILKSTSEQKGKLTFSKTVSFSNLSSSVSREFFLNVDSESSMSDKKDEELLENDLVVDKGQSPQNDLDQDQEVDDIELIFTTDDTKDSDFKEQLVSIDATGESTAEGLNLLQCPHSDIDNFDVSDRELDDDVFNDNFENENQENFNFQSFDSKRDDSQLYNSKSDNSINHEERSFKSYYSYQDSSFENKSLEKDESFDRFDDKIRIVETDISKVGILDVEYGAGRRNTCPNPIQYRPLIHREAISRYNTKKSRPILTHSNAIRKESGAQTDISAIPGSAWRSESSLANKGRIGENAPTLPSRFPLPGSRLRLSEKTVEARRVLLSDIGFTSMVPELSRSADHLCPGSNLKPPTAPIYGQFLRTTDLYSPGYTSQKFTWTTTTATPSEGSQTQSRCSSVYPLASPPAPSRRCSAPVSPSRRTILKHTPSKVRFANGSLPELRSDWTMTVDSGDSTDSLVEEAENYLRRSIDCLTSGRDLPIYSEKKTVPRRASAPEPSRDNVPPQGWQPFLPRISRDLKPDHWVKVITPEGRVRGGRVRYIGPVVTQNEQFVGVQLSSPEGHSDGTFGNRRYFQCEPYHGIFVPFKKVIMGWRP